MSPKNYDNPAPRLLWQEIANLIVISRHFKKELLTVAKVSKRLGRTQDEIKAAISGMWVDLMVYKGNVICKSWLKYPEHIYYLK